MCLANKNIIFEHTKTNYNWKKNIQTQFYKSLVDNIFILIFFTFTNFSEELIHFKKKSLLSRSRHLAWENSWNLVWKFKKQITTKQY